MKKLIGFAAGFVVGIWLFVVAVAVGAVSIEPIDLDLDFEE